MGSTLEDADHPLDAEVVPSKLQATQEETATQRGPEARPPSGPDLAVRELEVDKPRRHGAGGEALDTEVFDAVVVMQPQASQRLRASREDFPEEPRVHGAQFVPGEIKNLERGANLQKQQQREREGERESDAAMSGHAWGLEPFHESPAPCPLFPLQRGWKLPRA